MKENSVPEKIYLTSDEKNSYVFTQKRSDGMGVEYIRTDAVIEKACKAYCKTCKMPNCYSSNSSKCKFLNNFRENMKGE